MSFLTQRFIPIVLFKSSFIPLSLCSHLLGCSHVSHFFKLNGGVSAANTQDPIKEEIGLPAAAYGERWARAASAAFPPRHAALMRVKRRPRRSPSRLIYCGKRRHEASACLPGSSEADVSEPSSRLIYPHRLLFTTQTVGKPRGIRVSTFPVKISA